MAIVNVGTIANDHTGDSLRAAFIKVNNGLNPYNVKYFGAVGDGATDDSAAFTAAAATGGVFVPKGNFAIGSSISVPAPVTFDDGAYITVAAAKNVSITGVVTSKPQWIFQGSGTVTLDLDGSGLNDVARYAHISWFGAVPSTTVNQAPYINACYTAFGNSREGVVEFDRGVYRLDSSVTVSRGMYTTGAGSRITVFTLTNFSGTDAFVTNGDGCVFEKFQFDTTGNTPSRSCVHLAHNDCSVRDIMFGPVFCGVLDEGRGSRIERLYSNSGTAGGAGSCIAKLGGNRTIARDIRSMGTPAPESVVLVTSTTASITDFQIENVEASSDAIGVYVVSGNQAISRGSIRGVRARGSGASAVNISNTVGSSITQIDIEDITVIASVTTGLTLNCSAGSINGILFSKLNCGAVTTGVSVTQSGGGAIAEVKGGVCKLDQATTPVALSGTITNFSLLPQSYSPRQYSIANNAVVSQNLGANLFVGLAFVASNTPDYGIARIRAATTPSITSVSASANFAVTTGVLTGTTGTVGKLTLSADVNGMIYLENRTGGTVTAILSIIAGNSA